MKTSLDSLNNPETAERLIGHYIPLGRNARHGKILVNTIQYDPMTDFFIVNDKYWFMVDFIRRIMVDLVLGELREKW